MHALLHCTGFYVGVGVGALGVALVAGVVVTLAVGGDVLLRRLGVTA